MDYCLGSLCLLATWPLNRPDMLTLMHGCLHLLLHACHRTKQVLGLRNSGQSRIRLTGMAARGGCSGWVHGRLS